MLNVDNRGGGQGNQRHQQDKHGQFDVSDEDEIVDNLFADQDQRNRRGGNQDVRREDQDERLQQRWESDFRSEIPEFLGTLNPEDFIDWIHMVEEILEFKQVPPEMCVSLVVTRFKGRAMAWWQQLKESRRQAGKQRTDSWDRLLKHMRRNFLPYKYERTLYNKLQNLRQGNRSVEEYATDFFHFASRVPTPESESQMISRFIGGLRIQLQNALQQFNPCTVSEAHQLAAATEVKLQASCSSSSSRPRGQQVSSSDTTTAMDKQSTRPDDNNRFNRKN